MAKTKADLEKELAAAQQELQRRGRQVERLRLELGMRGPARTETREEPRTWVPTPDNVIEFRERLRAALPKRKRYA